MKQFHETSSNCEAHVITINKALKIKDYRSVIMML